MKYLITAMVALIILIASLNVESKTPETTKVNGVVTVKNDTVNKASFFNVFIDGTVYCTFTDEYGEFELNLPKGEYELVITSKTYGKIKRDIKVSKKKNAKYIIFL